MPMSSGKKGWFSNKRLFRWHGWLGLNLGLLLFVICFSGTMAVFSHEIDWLINPAMRVAVRDAPIDWEAIQRGVERAYPYHEATFIIGPRHEGFAALVYATDPAGRSVKLWVNPYTGVVQGRSSFWNVQRFFRSFHRRMFVPGTYGIMLVTFFALVLLFSAVTGLLFYKGWYRHLFRLRRRNWRLFFSDAHRLAGVWGILFAGIIVITGVWYGVERFSPAPVSPDPEIGAPALRRRGAHPELLSLNRLAKIAEAAFPGFEVQEVLPGAPGRPIQMRGASDAWLVRPRANRVYLDPVTGEVLARQQAGTLSLYHRWSDTADPLHFGTFGGWVTQGLWFVFGLLLSSLMLTGGWLWYVRAEKKALAAGAGRHPRWGRAAAALPVMVLLGSAVLGYVEARDYMGLAAPKVAVSAPRAVGPWQVRVLQLGPLKAGEETAFKVYLSSEKGAPSYRHAMLRLGGTSAEVQSEHPLTVTFPVPEENDAVLTLRLTTWNGATHQARIPAKTFHTPTGVVLAGASAPKVPGAVWAVIAAFAVLTLGIVGSWLYVAPRVASRRRKVARRRELSVHRVRSVTADLPMPD